MENLSEKQIKEMRALLDEAEKKKQDEIRSAEVQEKRAVETPEVNKEEVEMRAVEQFLRKQDGPELRNLITTSDPGKLTVPTSLSNVIIEKLFEVAPLFGRARSFTPVNGYLEILRESDLGTLTNSGFVGEWSNVIATDFTLNKVKLEQRRVGTAIELSQQLINDSGVDVVNYATNILSRRLGMTLDKTVITGTKADKFEGLQGNVTINDITAASATAIAIDELLQLTLSMNPNYLDGAVFVMNRNTFNMVAKLKDANNQYYLIRDVANSGPAYRLFGFPVLINEAVDNHAVGARSVLFVNMEQAYATMIKKGLNFQYVNNDTTQALRGSVMIMLDGYMDGKVINENAAKWLRVTGTPVIYPA